MFDGEQAKGPLPRLFALNPEEAKANLSNDPERAFRDLQRIFSRLGVTENIPAHSSFEMVLTPRQVPFTLALMKPLQLPCQVGKFYSKLILQARGDTVPVQGEIFAPRQRAGGQEAKDGWPDGILGPHICR
jgi:hypothetical protein